MPTVNLTVEQLAEAIKQLSPEEIKQLEEELRQKLADGFDDDAWRDLIAAAVEAADWWDDEGDKEWDRWQP